MQTTIFFARRKHQNDDVNGSSNLPAVQRANYILTNRASRLSSRRSPAAESSSKTSARSYLRACISGAEACYSGSETRAKLIPSRKTEVDFNDCRKVTHILIQIELGKIPKSDRIVLDSSRSGARFRVFVVYDVYRSPRINRRDVFPLRGFETYEIFLKSIGRREYRPFIFPPSRAVLFFSKSHLSKLRN